MVGNDGYAGIGSRRSGGKEMMDIGLAELPSAGPTSTGSGAAVERYQAAALDVAARCCCASWRSDWTSTLGSSPSGCAVRSASCGCCATRPAPPGDVDDRRAHRLRRHHAARHGRRGRAGGPPAGRHVARRSRHRRGASSSTSATCWPAGRTTATCRRRTGSWPPAATERAVDPVLRQPRPRPP